MSGLWAPPRGRSGGPITHLVLYAHNVCLVLGAGGVAGTNRSASPHDGNDGLVSLPVGGLGLPGRGHDGLHEVEVEGLAHALHLVEGDAGREKREERGAVAGY